MSVIALRDLYKINDDSFITNSFFLPKKSVTILIPPIKKITSWSLTSVVHFWFVEVVQHYDNN